MELQLFKTDLLKIGHCMFKGEDDGFLHVLTDRMSDEILLRNILILFGNTITSVRDFQFDSGCDIEFVTDMPFDEFVKFDASSTIK